MYTTDHSNVKYYNKQSNATDHLVLCTRCSIWYVKIPDWKKGKGDWWGNVGIEISVGKTPTVNPISSSFHAGF